MRRSLTLICCLAALGAAGAQLPAGDPDLQMNFPPIPPLTMYQEVLKFRAEVERQIEAVRPALPERAAVVTLVDTLLSKWDHYGKYMDREHGHFPNMAEGRPYWLITTDDAADTLVDRLIPVLESYIRAQPKEILGEVRAEWEIRTAEIGVPSNRIFGFHMVELARRGAVMRRQLASERPDRIAEVHDAYLRFLWDIAQFYRQLHSTWYDKYTSNVAKEDWIIHRMKGACEEPQWQLLLSFTAIGVDTTNTDPMNDKFMHRLVLFDPACPETVDFVVPLPHFRLMEQDLNARSAEERQRILQQVQREAMERGQRERAPGEGSR